VQCTTGTGGAHNQPTATSGPAGGSNQGAAAGPSAANGASGASDAASAAGDSAAQAADATSATVCDADTGACTSVNGSGSGGSGGQARAFPQTLAATRGWGATQTLMALAMLLTVGLVLAPGLTARFLANRKPK
jgi:predicted component of type VI protein secretion system